MDTTLKIPGEAGHNACQQLLVRSWRLIMTRGVECPLIPQGFTCACGANGRETFQSFCTFLCALALGRRRCLLVNPPGCRILTPDEIRMLAVIAASQHDHAALLQAHLRWLAQRSLRNTVRQSARELADHLNSSRLQLPAPV